MLLRMLTVLIVFGLSLEASAYVLKQSPDGDLVRWFDSEVQIVLDPSLEVLGNFEDVADSIVDAFEIWQEQSNLPMSFDIYVADCDKEWEEDDRINCFSATTDYIADADDIGAKTVITYSQNSGQILHVEVIFSAAVGSWFTGLEEEEVDPSSRIALLGVALHEVGHLLGLDHSAVVDAVMYPTLAVGDLSRDELGEDDIAGIAELYADFSELEPWAADEADGVAYCAVSPTIGGVSGLNYRVMIVWLGLLWFVGRRRRRGKKPVQF